MNDQPPRPRRVVRLLFVCVENANRSQMAEAFARMLGGQQVECYSAGSAPSGQVNPRAVQAMAELGYDLSRHRSKSLREVPLGPYDAVVTMGCGDRCPQVKAQLHLDWPLPDPKHLPPEQFNQVRDAVRRHVEALLVRLGVLESSQS